MIQIENRTGQSLAFVTGQKDGQPVVTDVRPGETAPVDIAADNVHVAAGAATGAIVVHTSARAAKRAAAEAPAS